jgi:hypothetical protein
MKSGMLLLIGGAAALVYFMTRPVTVAGTSAVPITSSGPLAMNCPGDPACPGNQLIYGPTDAQLNAIPQGLSGLFSLRGPGGWAA